MRPRLALILCGCLIGGSLSAQDPGTIEVGFFGSQRDPGAQSQRSAGALITVFVKRRLAIETHQDMLSFGPGAANGSLWTVIAQPLGTSRIHVGPGVRLSSSGQMVPRVEPSALIGARWTLYDWVGLRADAHFTRARLAEDSPGSRFEMALFGGLSIRVRQ